MERPAILRRASGHSASNGGGGRAGPHGRAAHPRPWHRHRHGNRAEYGVFHVPEAKGSPYIPAQDFVDRYGIRSVVGFGGVLPSGDLFSVILFARVPVTTAAADRFRTLALDLKSCLLRYSQSEIFE